MTAPRASGSAGLPATSVGEVDPSSRTLDATVCPYASSTAGAPARSSSPTDLRVRRLLRIPEQSATTTEASARSALERSLLISMVRCLLTYVILPFVAPAVGATAGVTPVVGVVVGLVAIVFNLASIRRFWRADHRYRWHYTALAVTVISLLLWLVVADVVELLS